MQFSNEYLGAAHLRYSATLSNKEANSLLRAIFGEKYEEGILSFRLNLERRIRKGEDVTQTVLRFLEFGSLAHFGVQAALYDIQGR